MSPLDRPHVWLPGAGQPLLLRVEELTGFLVAAEERYGVEPPHDGGHGIDARLLPRLAAWLREGVASPSRRSASTS